MFVVTPKGLSDCSIFIRILLQFKYLVSKVKKKMGHLVLWRSLCSASYLKIVSTFFKGSLFL